MSCPRAAKKQQSPVTPEARFFKMNSAKGERLGNYEILEALGHGATSVIFKVSRLSDGRIFAAKVLHSFLLDKEDSLRRFEQEAKAQIMLSHPNIVKVHSLEQSDSGQAFLIMDFLDGKPLSELLKAGPLPLPRAWNLFIQIADALNHAHSHGVLHRSLKPGNIIVTRDSGGKETAFLTDFGMAKLLPSSGLELQELTAKGAIIGSPLYMSPEQCLGRELDQRADIYSMGCLMYICLTGKPPLKGEHIIETMSKHVSENPLRFDKLVPELKIPGPAQNIVFKCMAKRPEDRFESMELLQKDLLRFQQGRRPKAMSMSISAVFAAPAAPQVNELGDDRYLKIALLAILVLLLGLFAYAAWKGPQRQDPNKVLLGKKIQERSTHPISALALLNLADELLFTDRPDEARALYREAILKAEEKEREPSPLDNEVLAMAHYGLSRIYFKMADWNQCEKELRIASYVQGLCAATAAPGKERLQVDLAECLINQGKLEEARRMLLSLISTAGEKSVSARALLMLSSIAERSNEAPDKYLLQAMRILKGQSGLSRRLYCLVLERYCELLIRRNEIQKAIALLKNALKEQAQMANDAYALDSESYLAAQIIRIYLSSGAFADAEKICAEAKEFLLSADSARNSSQFFRSVEKIEELKMLLDILKRSDPHAAFNYDRSPLPDAEHLGPVAMSARIILFTKAAPAELNGLLAKYKSKALRKNSMKAEYYALLAQNYLQNSRLSEAMENINLALEAVSKTDEQALHIYCLRIKCKIFRAQNRPEAAELIEKTIGKPNDFCADFDFLLPPYSIAS
ncbi:MAG: serine/threonine protein kinase [Candidatus Obscuribacterales bacterium]|nr:serine/threonine protein kinase [Candidatus Obscuribacterales bacterium]